MLTSLDYPASIRSNLEYTYLPETQGFSSAENPSSDMISFRLDLRDCIPGRSSVKAIPGWVNAEFYSIVFLKIVRQEDTQCPVFGFPDRPLYAGKGCGSEIIAMVRPGFCDGLNMVCRLYKVNPLGARYSCRQASIAQCP